MNDTTKTTTKGSKKTRAATVHFAQHGGAAFQPIATRPCLPNGSHDMTKPERMFATCGTKTDAANVTPKLCDVTCEKCKSSNDYGEAVTRRDRHLFLEPIAKRVRSVARRSLANADLPMDLIDAVVDAAASAIWRNTTSASTQATTRADDAIDHACAAIVAIAHDLHVAAHLVRESDADQVGNLPTYDDDGTVRRYF